MVQLPGYSVETKMLHGHYTVHPFNPIGKHGFSYFYLSLLQKLRTVLKTVEKNIVCFLYLSISLSCKHTHILTHTHTHTYSHTHIHSLSHTHTHTEDSNSNNKRAPPSIRLCNEMNIWIFLILSWVNFTFLGFPPKKYYKTRLSREGEIS